MFTIGTFASQLGVPASTLRKWEARYGVPSPSRSPGGTRLYSAVDLEQMRDVKRLIDQGMRPATALARFGQTEPDATKSDARRVVGIDAEASITPQIRDLIDRLLNHDLAAVRDGVSRALLADGACAFIETLAAPLMREVGHRWMTGDLSVFSEHAISSVLEVSLNNAIRQLRPSTSSPRILLATPPGEQHRLGLSMAGLVMASSGADCIDLGNELPLDMLLKAIDAYQPDVIGLSFSSATQIRQGMRFLNALCERLDAKTEIWAGGSGLKRMPSLPARVQIFIDTETIPARIADLQSRPRRVVQEYVP